MKIQSIILVCVLVIIAVAAILVFVDFNPDSIFAEATEVTAQQAVAANPNVIINYYEFLLLQRISQDSDVQHAVTSSITTTFPLEKAIELARGYLPETAEVRDLTVLGSGSICLEYWLDGDRILLEKLTGETKDDIMRKTIAVYSFSGKVKAVYTNTNNYEYTVVK